MYDDDSDEILETRGDYRVLLMSDLDPLEPYNDGRSPIVQLDPRGYWSEASAEYLDKIGGYRPDNIDAIERAAARFYREPELFERYMRAFHGTTEVEWWDSRGNSDYVYVTFDTSDWREHNGLTDEYLARHADLFAKHGLVSLAEYRAYVEGDVYGYVVERQTDVSASDYDEMPTWETVDSCWGFYGYEYAVEAAREALANFA